MRFFDTHVRFDFKDFRALGFSNVGILNNNVHESLIHSPNDLSKSLPKKINIINCNNVELLKKGMKKFDIIYFNGFYLDSVIIRAAAENRKPFEIPINEILTTSGIKRAYIMNRISQFLRLCNKHNADYIITSRAKDILEVRTPYELISIGEILGLTKDQAIRAITQVSENILEKVSL